MTDFDCIMDKLNIVAYGYTGKLAGVNSITFYSEKDDEKYKDILDMNKKKILERGLAI